MWQEYAQRQYTERVKKTWNQLSTSLLNRKGINAYIPIIVVIVLMFFGASWMLFWSATDAARYQCYALTFWLGGDALNLLPQGQCSFFPDTITTVAPFHALPLEYPPLTLIPFSLALVMPLGYYQFAFALLMALVAFVVYWLLMRYGPRGSALVCAFYLFLGAVGIALVRYDLLPAALTLICVIAAERKHWYTAYVALAVAVLLKIYPILFLPALFVAEQRAFHRLSEPESNPGFKSTIVHLWQDLRQWQKWRWRSVLVFLFVMVGITAFFAVMDFQGAVVNQLAYFMKRPLQIESLGSSILWLGQFLGFPLYFESTFGSMNSVSDLSSLVSLACTCLLILGVLYCFWLQWRGKLDLTQTIIALLLVFITTGKVFSPQYLIWLIPLLAYAGAFDAFWLLVWGSVSILTSYIYIFLNSQVRSFADLYFIHGFFETVSLRNILFVFITAAYLFNWFQARQRRVVATRVGRQGREAPQPIEALAS